jgi:hypothetical protein
LEEVEDNDGDASVCIVVARRGRAGRENCCAVHASSEVWLQDGDARTCEKAVVKEDPDDNHLAAARSAMAAERGDVMVAAAEAQEEQHAVQIPLHTLQGPATSPCRSLVVSSDALK